MTYRFLEHIATADVAFEAYGTTREELFISCAEALLHTMVHQLEDVERVQEEIIKLEHTDLDLLLYSFLEELVFQKDARQLLLHADVVRIEEADDILRLEAVTSGEKIAPQRHRLVVDVKAVTLHHFQVVQEEDGWRATVVLDI
ncbi:archease [Geobacter chapellei]|uniref:Archease n=2 Tax=Pelotalea chapellei TaxID=44671 RepID=A0ABS5U4A6_9BACT|nr:archease [Pelotalea chapellei]